MTDTFKPKRVLVMIFLTVVTLGIYVPFYFREMKKTTDKLQTTQKLNSGMIGALFIMSFLNALRIVVEYLYPGFFKDMWGVHLFYLVMVWIVTFEFRDILKEHFNFIQKQKISFNVPETFIFTFFYLQYQINRTSGRYHVSLSEKKKVS